MYRKSSVAFLLKKMFTIVVIHKVPPKILQISIFHHQVSETGEDNTKIAKQARHRIIVSPEQATAVATY